jgi:hypothetical protein
MIRQTYIGKVDWIIAHDVDMPELSATDVLPSNWRVHPVRAPWTWTEGMNTQAALMALGLRRAMEHGAEQRPVLIVEDDDYYPKQYLVSMEDGFRKVRPECAAVGYMRAWYYDVRARTWKAMYNIAHASLCETGVIGRAVHELLRICDERARHPHRKGFIDIDLWNRMHQMYRKGIVYLMDQVPGARPIGIKGMPGRAGVGSGDRPNGGWTPDHDLAWLRRHIGDEDAEAYRRFGTDHDLEVKAAMNLKRLATETARPVASPSRYGRAAAGRVPVAVGKVTPARYECGQEDTSGQEENGLHVGASLR